MKSNKLLEQQQQQSKQEQEELEIPKEIIEKFDNDRELVGQFLNAGYSIEELKGSVITHPTKYDPVCMVGDQQAGIWLYSDNNHTTNGRIRYTNSRF